MRVINTAELELPVSLSFLGSLSAGGIGASVAENLSLLKSLLEDGVW